jgi:tight adherence protein C
MRIYLRIVLLLFIGILPGAHSWAQTCAKVFTQISPSCISSIKKPALDKAINVSSELINNVYFYKTPGGYLGKLKIIGVTVAPTECTLFLEAVTFLGSKDEIYEPNSSISISVDQNHWLRSRMFLDKEGTSALVLERPLSEKNCKLKVTEGSEIRLFQAKLNEEKPREENLMLFYGPLILVFIAIFIVVRGFLEEQDKYKTQEALDEAENASKTRNKFLFLKLTRPFYKRYFLPLVQGTKNKQGLRNKYRQQIANAGLSKEMTPEEFVALKFFMILGGPFVFLAVRWVMSETWPLTITPVMAIVGFFYPNIWLKGLISNRAEDIQRAMPFIVDMLALSVEAGLDFMAAIQRVIEKAPSSPLVEEFETLIKETKIGSSRAEGLRQMGWRVNIIEINSFCATLIAADSVGASIGPILKQLSGELRVKRSSKAEQKGATAATKILIPMIFFILPAVLVAIFAPMVLKLMSGEV